MKYGDNAVNLAAMEVVKTLQNANKPTKESYLSGNLTTVLAVVVIAIVLIALVVAGPLLTLLALNTLFGLAIGYNFSTWAAMLWLQLMFVARYKS